MTFYEKYFINELFALIRKMLKLAGVLDIIVKLMLRTAG